MKFRTEVQIEDSVRKIDVNDHVFSIGSCFSTELYDKINSGQLQAYHNPFGTIFNPYSIAQSIKRIYQSDLYQEDDLVQYKDTVLSLDHHTSFNSRFVHQTLENVNTPLQEANEFLQKTNWVIITYGTSYIYEFLPKNKLVANCHKIPGKFFEKRMLTSQEIATSIQGTIDMIKDIAKLDVQILFTLSPVRHTKDGMQENSRSKARLLDAMHEVIEKNEQCTYLPVYEMLMDDLRDYRFYKEDMIHPNATAVDYVWENFEKAYLKPETQVFVNENYKINKALAHRVKDDTDPKYQDFLSQIKSRISEQQKKVHHKIFV